MLRLVIVVMRLDAALRVALRCGNVNPLPFPVVRLKRVAVLELNLYLCALFILEHQVW